MAARNLSCMHALATLARVQLLYSEENACGLPKSRVSGSCAGVSQMMLSSHVSGGFWLQMPCDLAGLVAGDKHEIALECADSSKAASGYQYQVRAPALAPHAAAVS